MTAAILAIDVGTSRVRARLFSLDGLVLDEGSRPTIIESPFQGAVELDCERLWNDLCEILAGLPKGAIEVCALGVAAQLGTVFVDGNGAALGQAILWADTRASAEADELNRAFGGVASKISGRRMAPELVAPRVHWLRRHKPRVLAGASYILSVKDFIVQRMTGVALTDETHASYSGLFDVAKRRWSEELIGLLGVDSRLLPPVRGAVAAAGPLTPKAASRFGVRPGTPVAVGASDGTAGAIGAGAVRAGVTVDVAGTTDVVLHTVAKPVRDRRRATILNAHAAPALWTVGGPTGFTGGAVAWTARLLGITAPEDVAAALSRALAEVPPGCDGLVFHPALTGSRFPDWNASERGLLSGIRPNHGALHLLRAVQEGAAFTVANALAAIRMHGVRIDEMVVVGGLSADTGAVKLRADATGVPAATLATEEASSIGVAMIAGVCAGVFSNLTVAADRFVRRGIRYEPDHDNMRTLSETRARWNAVRLLS